MLSLSENQTEKDKLKDECGVMACVSCSSDSSNLDVASNIVLGLVGLQHRGQESSGIVTGEVDPHKPLNVHKGMGLVSQVFKNEDIKKLTGVAGIGHNRYSTAGRSELTNCQPFVVNMRYGSMAVAHNGELVNKDKLKKAIFERGVGLSTQSDSELLTQILCIPLESEDESIDIALRIKKLMQRSPTSYSLLVLHAGKVYAARDPYGNRPLCVGRVLQPISVQNLGENINKRSVEAWIVSSESCVFQSIGAEYVREVLPGEVICVSQNGCESMGAIVQRPDCSQFSAFCIFEYIYFSRMDSQYQGNSVYKVRRNSGIILAIESPVQADVVSTVPESATPAAIGYSRQSGIPYEDVLAKNHYVGRTFIKPTQRLRKLAIEKKFGVLADNVVGRRIVLVDDSIVRGNTMQCIIAMLRKGGAAEVHVRIASPPVKFPCYMGINIPTSSELLANNLNSGSTAQFLGADSVKYLSTSGLLNAVGGPAHEEGVSKEKSSSEGAHFQTETGHCTACLTGNYPAQLLW